MIPIQDPDIDDPKDADVMCLAEEFKIPKSYYKLISKVHNTIAGHFGLEVTCQRLEDLGHRWAHRREHVRRFINLHCPCCQKMRHLKVPIEANRFITSTRIPWERLNIDTIGPLPKDDNNNEYIIVLIDCFSRFIMLYAVPDTSAYQAARCILHCMGIFGAPSQILSDRGSQFVNQTIDQLLYLLGVEHQLTLAYSHEENSIVERANKEIMRHLRAIIFHGNVKTRWSFNLPLVQRIFNASTKKSLGVTPAQIIFGNSINLDR